MDFNIYMKSGNVIFIDGVEKLEVRDGVVGISYINIKQGEECQYKLLVESLTLEQVEAIVEVKDEVDQ